MQFYNCNNYPGKNECTTKLLPGKYEQCLGFVSNGVIPNLGSDTTELDLPAVQRCHTFKTSVKFSCT